MAQSPTSSRGSVSPFTSATVTLTNAQVKALPTTAVELVAAQGAGVVIVPILAWLHLAWVADYTNVGDASVIKFQYAGVEATPLASFDESVQNGVTNILQDGASHAAFSAPRGSIPAGGGGTTTAIGQFSDDPGPTNAALQLAALNAGSHTGDFTGGNAGNSLKVTVYYATFTN